MTLQTSGNIQKADPLCPVFSVCGGCQYQDIPYAQELRLKEERVRDVLGGVLSGGAGLFLPIMASPKEYHYRNRLDLKLIRARDGIVRVGFSPVEGKGDVVEVERCPIAMEQISAFIPTLRREAEAVLPRQYRMANLTVRCGDAPGVVWGGIGRRSLSLFEREYLFTETGSKNIFYSLDTFFQANLSILPRLAGALRALDVWDKNITFCDLYGGVGPFSLIVHDLVRRVILVEENVHAARMAAYNTRVNRTWNIAVHEGRVEDVLPAVLPEVLAGDAVVMVDPPRAGLGEGFVGFLNSLDKTKVRTLIYLSCNPESLAKDLLGFLAGEWRVTSVQPFDFFPRTRHVETLVVLKR